MIWPNLQLYKDTQFRPKMGNLILMRADQEVDQEQNATPTKEMDSDDDMEPNLVW